LWAAEAVEGLVVVVVEEVEGEVEVEEEEEAAAAARPSRVGVPSCRPPETGRCLAAPASLPRSAART
jgi:hypothetical protein